MLHIFLMATSVAAVAEHRLFVRTRVQGYPFDYKRPLDKGHSPLISGVRASPGPARPRGISSQTRSMVDEVLRLCTTSLEHHRQ